MKDSTSQFASRDNQSQSKYMKKIAHSYLIQKTKVLIHLAKATSPQCMREIEIATKIPVYILCRILTEFQKRKIVEVKSQGVSPISRFPNVKFYGLVNNLFGKWRYRWS